MQWIGRFVPRLTLIHPTHKAVLFGPRGGAKARGPGLVFYWPITHSMVVIPVTTQSLQFNSQVLPNDDNVTISSINIPTVFICAVAVQYRVHDPVLFSTKALDMHALVENRTKAVIAKQHINNILYIENTEKSTLHTELLPYGITLESLDVIQHGTGLYIKNAGDWCYSDKGEIGRS